MILPPSLLSHSLPDDCRAPPEKAAEWLHEHGWQTGQNLRIFGYGSLMWQPGFPFLNCHPALLPGYHRRFCVRSHRYRGTPESPGLVLGLDHGGSCWGMVFEVAGDDVPAVAGYLWDREMAGDDVYHPRMIDITLNNQKIAALGFVINRHSKSYYHAANASEIAAIIATSHGASGSNLAYLEQTVNALETLSLRDQALHSLLALTQLFLPQAAAQTVSPPPVLTD